MWDQVALDQNHNRADNNEYKFSLHDALLQFRLLKYLILEL